MTGRRQEIVGLIVLSLLAFLPFVGRPVFVDDHAHFREALSWGHNSQHLYPSQTEQLGWTPGNEPGEANPPVYFYLMSTWTRWAGPESWKAHLCLLPLQVLGVLAFYGLARRYVVHVFWASLLWLMTPHFWLTANTLLLDSLLAPFLLIGLYLWIKGWEKGNSAASLLAVVVLSALALTKYTGVIGIALAAMWVLMQAKDKRSTRWLYLLIPVAGFLGWSRWTTVLYGASHFATVARTHMVWPSFGKALTLMIFSSGTTTCLAFGLLPLFRSRSQKAVTAGILFAALMAGLALGFPFTIDLQMGIELGIFLAWCWFVIGRSAHHLPGQRFLWAWIVLAYAELTVAIGWVCARYLVIVGPALVLLTVQRIEETAPELLQSTRLKTGAVCGLALISGLLAASDYAQATVDRDMARQVRAWRQTGQLSEKIYYPAAALGGLGFYLDTEQTEAVVPGSPVPPGALVLLPRRTLSSRFYPLLSDPHLVRRFEYPTVLPFRTLDVVSGAGFYGSIWVRFLFPCPTLRWRFTSC